MLVRLNKAQSDQTVTTSSSKPTSSRRPCYEGICNFPSHDMKFSSLSAQAPTKKFALFTSLQKPISLEVSQLLQTSSAYALFSISHILERQANIYLCSMHFSRFGDPRSCLPSYFICTPKSSNTYSMDRSIKKTYSTAFPQPQQSQRKTLLARSSAPISKSPQAPAPPSRS